MTDAQLSNVFDKCYSCGFFEKPAETGGFHAEERRNLSLNNWHRVVFVKIVEYLVDSLLSPVARDTYDRGLANFRYVLLAAGESMEDSQQLDESFESCELAHRYQPTGNFIPGFSCDSKPAVSSSEKFRNVFQFRQVEELRP